MPARGKHRRQRIHPLTRGIVAAGAGGVALALPITGATGAHAVESAQVAQVAQFAKAGKVTVPDVRLITYKVVRGDTLFKIARKHHTKGGWKKLYKANRAVIGNDPAMIYPGLTLTLGTKKVQSSSSKAKATSKAPKAPKASTAPAKPAAPAAAPAAAKSYTNDLDGWIKEALDVMAKNGIPGTYDGIYRNIMRESSGNPQAINNWDSNAAAGTPSKGLLQVIDPTFAAYHVPGTANDPFDPVANIAAACNYAADRYGSIDNVNGPY
ncbi:transglycosylase SLT domain-containing protein [Streptomyces sporangiiformans]|uniref:LysM peptidoglycan-binding domain-containing protein n=1 Tax=Streptomyces sporangiiformans TaxID=2315329 RepID=A0A505DG65_9ACTN|nr:transglycosylase SLT domain-containing protein [Streptomyces sporangiiformans]TPQ22047.1 LysM peptidoglycan-binding domain-containing protein [Streptomyces sporangiiformans]